MAKVISFKDKTSKRAKEHLIYEWAKQNKAELTDECRTKVCNLKFENDDLTEDTEELMVSLFVDPNSTNIGIMRRDWKDIQAVDFVIIANCDAFAKKAPNSYKHMIENGKLLYRYYNADTAEKHRLLKSGRIPFGKYDH